MGEIERKKQESLIRVVGLLYGSILVGLSVALALVLSIRFRDCLTDALAIFRRWDLNYVSNANAGGAEATGTEAFGVVTFELKERWSAFAMEQLMEASKSPRWAQPMAGRWERVTVLR